MGNSKSLGPNPDTPDPVSGLSPRDINLVRKSWKPIFKNKVANGTLIFKQLFTTEPETKHFFEMLRDLPITEIEQSVPFRAHVINLMTSFNMAITHLHEPEVVIAMMHKVGKAHNERKVRRKHFMILQGVLVDIFTNVLKLDENTIGAWGRSLEFWYRSIFEKLDH